MTLKRTPLRRSIKPLRRTELKRGNKPLAKISPHRKVPKYLEELGLLGTIQLVLLPDKVWINPQDGSHYHFEACHMIDSPDYVEVKTWRVFERMYDGKYYRPCTCIDKYLKEQNETGKVPNWKPPQKPLKRGNSLKKSPLRRITPKQARRLKKQAQDKQEVLKNMDEMLCPQCNRPLTPFNPLDPDHVIQRGKGGTDDPKNKKYKCRFCHDRRHNGTARQQHPENYK